MPKQKKEATGKAVFNTNNDTEVSQPLGNEATGTAVFNTNNDTNERTGVARQPGGKKEATGQKVFNTNKDLNR